MFYRRRRTIRMTTITVKAPAFELAAPPTAHSQEDKGQILAHQIPLK